MKYGAVFAVMVQIFFDLGAIAIQTFGRPEFCHGAEMWFETELCSVAVQNLVGAGNLSLCRSLVAGKCAYPGAAMCHSPGSGQ